MVVPPASSRRGAAASPKCSTPSVPPSGVRNERTAECIVSLLVSRVTAAHATFPLLPSCSVVDPTNEIVVAGHWQASSRRLPRSAIYVSAESDVRRTRHSRHERMLEGLWRGRRIDVPLPADLDAGGQRVVGTGRDRVTPNSAERCRAGGDRGRVALGTARSRVS